MKRTKVCTYADTVEATLTICLNKCISEENFFFVICFGTFSNFQFIVGALLLLFFTLLFFTFTLPNVIQHVWHNSSLLVA